MIQEWQLVESRRDASHAFVSSMGDSEVCRDCGRRRWAHLDDGFRYRFSPYPTREELQFCHKSSYRCHPGFTRPGSFAKKEKMS